MTTDDDYEFALAAAELDAHDARLMASVKTLYADRDPVPDGLIERLQFELTLDALHAEVAILTQLDQAGAGVRTTSTEDVRTVTFTSESLTTMVTLTSEPNGTVRVDGWAAPGAGVRVEVLLTDGSRETWADEDGRFVFDALPAGLAKFALHTDHDGRLSTVLSPTIEL